MELDVSVGEPDVGALHAGQAVRFTVLAFPGREFSGTVAQVRQNPTIVSNVTTYDTVAYIDNHEGLLRPGMTANASIIIKHFDDALIAPLAALQWRPTPEIAKEYGLNPPHGSPSPGHAAAASQWGAVGSTNTGAVSPGGTGRVWVKRDDTIAPVTVRILAVDGANVAIEPVNGTLSPADAIVVNASK
jgi:HlyD family secretion protein